MADANTTPHTVSITFLYSSQSNTLTAWRHNSDPTIFPTPLEWTVPAKELQAHMVRTAKGYFTRGNIRRVPEGIKERPGRDVWVVVAA